MENSAEPVCLQGFAFKGREKGSSSEGAMAGRVEELQAALADAPVGGSTETASPGDLTRAWKDKGTFIACHPPARPSPVCWGSGRETSAGSHRDVLVGFGSRCPAWCPAFPCGGRKDEATVRGLR